MRYVHPLIAVALLVFAGCGDPIVVQQLEGSCDNDAECDDGLTCTINSCGDGKKCIFGIAAGRCFIDGACYAEGDTNLADSCGGCVPSVSQGQWTDVCSNADVITDTTPDANPDVTPDTNGPDGTPDTTPDVPVDVPTDSGQADADAAAETSPDVPASCGSDETCAEEAPTGWTGPIALFSGAPASAPACIGTYNNQEFNLNGSFNQGKAECGCSCGDVQGASCPDVSLTRYNNCGPISPPQGSWQLSDGTCTSLGGSQQGGGWSVGSGGSIIGGSCTASASENIDTPVFESVALGCGGASSSGACGDGGQCMPTPNSPFGAQLCIYQAGDTKCPDDSAYVDKQLAYANYTDTRECSACTCGPASGTCSGTVSMVDGAGCSFTSLLLGNIDTVDCANLGGGVDHAEYNATQNGSCEPSAILVDGEAIPTGSVTICCTTE